MCFSHCFCIITSVFFVDFCVPCDLDVSPLQGHLQKQYAEREVRGGAIFAGSRGKGGQERSQKGKSVCSVPAGPILGNKAILFLFILEENC